MKFFSKKTIAFFFTLIIIATFGLQTAFAAVDTNPRQVGTVATPSGTPLEIYHQGQDDPSPQSLYFYRITGATTGPLIALNGVHTFSEASSKAVAAATLGDGPGNDDPNNTPQAPPGTSSNDCGYIKAVATFSGPSYIGCTAAYLLGNTILGISGFFMWLGGIILNVVIQYTVVNISKNLGDMAALNVGWTVFRDVANISFIFILLYIAIGTILRLSGIDTKRMLATVIVVALLLNFSLFFTKVIIDGTNILALTFLSKITVNNQQVTAGGEENIKNAGLSNAILAPLGLGGLFRPPSDNPAVLGVFNNNNYPGIFLMYLFSSILLGVIGFVFFIASVLFIVRFVVLIFLLLLSPLAFAGMALPKTKSMISDKWWKTLFDQALFAPIFCMMMWVVLQIIKSGTFKAAGLVSAEKINTSFASIFSGDTITGGVGLFFNYMIVVALTIATLVISKTMASSGGSAVQSLVKKGTGYVESGLRGAGGYAGRGALRGSGIGALATKVENAAKDTRFGEFAPIRGLRKVTSGAIVGTKFGSKRSLADVQKENKERSEKIAKREDEEGIPKQFLAQLKDQRTATGVDLDAQHQKARGVLAAKKIEATAAQAAVAASPYIGTRAHTELQNEARLKAAQVTAEEEKVKAHQEAITENALRIQTDATPTETERKSGELRLRQESVAKAAGLTLPPITEPAKREAFMKGLSSDDIKDRTKLNFFSKWAGKQTSAKRETAIRMLKKAQGKEVENDAVTLFKQYMKLEQKNNSTPPPTI